MYDAAVIATVILMLISAGDYVRRAWIRETHPVPATWILMMVMMSLAFWMYWVSPNKSLTANIGVTSGLANITIILAGVIAANIRHGTLRFAFDWVQRLCLIFGACVVVFWWFTDQPLISYVLVQCIALIAYAATINRLWHAERCSEPYAVWAAALIATVIAIYPAWAKSDVFAWIYLGRAVPSTTFMIFLIWRAKQRMVAPPPERIGT